MPKINRYIIFDEWSKGYYNEDGRGWRYGKINDAFTFGECDLNYQKRILVHNDTRNEHIFKIIESGALLLIE